MSENSENKGWSWQKASEAAQKLGIETRDEYRSRTPHHGLPDDPVAEFSNFPRKPNGRPDWDLFFGRKNMK